MCGIAGAVARTDAPIDRTAVRRALAALAHRGPDAEGEWADPAARASLGSRRLAIIDVAGGDQPIGNEDGSVQVVVNGEIYNFRELRAELEGRGHRFSTRSDVESIVHLYEELGPRFVERLRGMFALALWDVGRRRLVLARDRLGKKPLVYGERAGAFVFASELAGLRAGWGTGDLDLAAIDAYLALGVVPAPRTIEACYRKLPPASTLILDVGRPPVIERYWQLRPPPNGRLDRPGARAALTEKLTEAVRLRLVSEVPLGLFLSGGVDSSIILALMAENSSRPVETFTVGFDDPAYDEAGPAREVAAVFGARHHELAFQPGSIDLLTAALRSYGEPFADSSCLPTYVLAQLAREHVTVALTGDGGDELFAGYPRYPWLLRLRRAAHFVPSAVARALAPLATGRGLLRRLGRTGELLATDDAGRLFELMSVFGTRRRRELRAFEVPDGERSAEAQIAAVYAATAGDPLDRITQTEAVSYLPDDLLVKMDIATMAHGLEARSPLLDHEVVELAFQLGSDLKLVAGRGKSILKETFAGRFPPGHLDRPKRGFGLPFERWIRDDVDGYFAAELRDGGLARSGLVHPAAVARLLDQQRAGGVEHKHRIFALVSLSVFLRERAEAAAARSS